MSYSRPVLEEIKSRIDHSKGLIQVITGPRQVGKTTLVKQLFQSAQWTGIYHVVEGSVAYDSGWIEALFNDAVIRQGRAHQPVILAIDEIQKIPNWSETIKRLYDQQKFRGETSVQLILLGSSHWLMQRGLSESLAGRFEQWDIGHWTFTELQQCFDISPEEYVYFGAYPGAMEMRKEESRWKAYVLNSLIEPVITKDVLLLERIEKPAVLRKVFELGSLYSGQILSYTKLLGQLQDAKNTTTVAHYLELLQRAGLLEGLQKFSRDNARRRSSSPKWQVMNNALLSAISGVDFKSVKSQPALWGKWVESAVGCHLIAHRGADLQMYYWNESNAEVDYVLKWNDKVIGIEVKSARGKVTGLNQFMKQFNPHKVYQLDERSLSWQQFIMMDPRELF
ncbi:MAG: ATP-binding protein [Flavobacteriales bacterium]